MYAQKVILKDLWKRMTDVDNFRVTLTIGIIFIIMAHALGSYLFLFNLILFKIIGIAFYIVVNFLGISMLLETIRLKRIANDKGYWFYWLNPTYINKMTFSELEECVAWVYSMHEYTCSVLHKHSHEHGADIIAIKGNETIAIQVKRWKNKVNSRSVNQVLKSKDFYHPTQFVVVTNNTFTKPTYKYAKTKGVQLIEQKELLHLYKEAKKLYKANKRLHKSKQKLQVITN